MNFDGSNVKVSYCGVKEGTFDFVCGCIVIVFNNLKYDHLMTFN
uniref:Uncharacterized protein n=1 Tax=Arundo donax TaxID=35708 RepID=A0A0A8ZLZ1_ARUDO